jgi:hypothetical protein
VYILYSICCYLFIRGTKKGSEYTYMYLYTVNNYVIPLKKVSEPRYQFLNKNFLKGIMNFQNRILNQNILPLHHQILKESMHAGKVPKQVKNRLFGPKSRLFGLVWPWLATVETARQQGSTRVSTLLVAVICILYYIPWNC